MMHAVLAKGSTATVTIGDWLTEPKPRSQPYCPICNQDLHPVGEVSQNVEVHFSHFPNAHCPTSKPASQAYAIFQAMPRTTPQEARKVKEYALDQLESIYQRCVKICPRLSWKEFLPLLGRATLLDAWALKDLDVLYIPYLLLCCADKFDPDPPGRPNTIFFVLEPQASASEFWHQPSGPRQRVWRIDVKTKNVEVIPMVLQEVVPWYRAKARQELGLP